MPKIHPAAVVEPGAKLADNVEVGPLCYVGADVTIAEDCRLIAQCHISGHTTIGRGNTFYPFSAIGQNAQDHGIEPGAVSYVEIGDYNDFREGSTVHAGTKPDTVTRIGNHCMFMNSSHVAHNCQIGNNVIMVGLSALAGYCEVGDNALISGVSGLHQFCRVGRFAIISGGSVFSKDIPPFMMAEGRNGGVKMINLIGLQRAGFSPEAIRVVKNIYKVYYRSGLAPSNALNALKTELPQTPEVLEFIKFCEESKRGVLSAKAEGHRL